MLRHRFPMFSPLHQTDPARYGPLLPFGSELDEHVTAHQPQSCHSLNRSAPQGKSDSVLGDFCNFSHFLQGDMKGLLHIFRRRGEGGQY